MFLGLNIELRKLTLWVMLTLHSPFHCTLYAKQGHWRVQRLHLNIPGWNILEYFFEGWAELNRTCEQSTTVSKRTYYPWVMHTPTVLLKVMGCTIQKFCLCRLVAMYIQLLAKHENQSLYKTKKKPMQSPSYNCHCWKIGSSGVRMLRGAEIKKRGRDRGVWLPHSFQLHLSFSDSICRMC